MCLNPKQLSTARERAGGILVICALFCDEMDKLLLIRLCSLADSDGVGVGDGSGCGGGGGSSEGSFGELK